MHYQRAALTVELRRLCVLAGSAGASNHARKGAALIYAERLVIQSRCRPCYYIGAMDEDRTRLVLLDRQALPPGSNHGISVIHLVDLAESGGIEPLTRQGHLRFQNGAWHQPRSLSI